MHDAAGRTKERQFIELTTSTYEYCYANPIRFSDPTGEQAPTTTAAAPAAATTSTSSTAKPAAPAAAKPAPPATASSTTLADMMGAPAVAVDNTAVPIVMQQVVMQQALQNMLPKPPQIQVLMADVYGSGHIGSESTVKATVSAINMELTVQTGENMMGLGGIIGFMFNGDRGSDIGAAIDNATMAAVALRSAKPVSPKLEKFTPTTEQPLIHSEAKRTIEQQANTLSKNIGKNSITMHTLTQQIRYDLTGKQHNNIPTPHTTIYKRNIVNGEIRSVTKASKNPTPMTQQEINAILDFIKHLKK